MIDIGLSLLGVGVLLALAHPADRLRAHRRWHRQQMLRLPGVRHDD
ncbi:MAG: hypothetical protein ACTHOJ_18075 [Sphingomonas oligoaromativorans]